MLFVLFSHLRIIKLIYITVMSEPSLKENNLKNGIPDFLHLLLSPYWIYHDRSHLHLLVRDSFCYGVVDDCRGRRLPLHPRLHPRHWLPPHVPPLHHHDYITQVCTNMQVKEYNL